MGSDNEKRRRSGPLPLFRLLVALLGISLLVFFTAEPAAVDTPASTAQRPHRKLIAHAGAGSSRKGAHKGARKAKPAPAPAPAVAQEEPAVAPRRAAEEPAAARQAAEEERAEAVRAEAPAAHARATAPRPAPARALALDALPPPRGLYRFSALGIDGVTRQLREFAGQVTLVVNVASKCGYTATNYEHLQPLYERYRDRGFAVLAFPCDCFGNQEPDSDAEIAAFARDTYGVTFPMFAKVPDVNGDSAAPVFEWLRLQNGFEADLTWNFNKFLIGRNGKPVKRYGPEWSEAIQDDVQAALDIPFEDAEPF